MSTGRSVSAQDTTGHKKDFTARALHLSKTDSLVASSLSVIAFLIYLPTMCRSVPYIDGGELTTVLWTLGIAHPTGYPLWTLLGYSFVHIPTFHEVVARANLFAAFCTALAVGIFYLAFIKIQVVLGATSDPPKSGTKKNKPAAKKNSLYAGNSPISIRIASVVGSLTLAFSLTYWKQATVVETYSLEMVLFATIIVVWLSLYNSPSRHQAYFAGLVLGLGFTNHMTTVLIVPASIFLLVSAYRQKKFKPDLLLFIFLGALTAAPIYLYLPIRAAQNPLMDWGNPDTLKRFIWQVTGKQFRTWMFSSFEVFQQQFGVFISSIYGEFRISIAIVLLGTVIAFINYRRLFWFTFLLIVGDLVYACNYSIHNIHSYFLLSFIGFAIFSVVGYRLLTDKVSRSANRKVSALLLIFPLVSALTNYSCANASNDHSVEKYTRDILTTVPPKSVILSFQWDIFVAGSIYYQHVDDLRPNVVVIDKELLRRSWYAAEVHSRYPFLFPKDDQVYRFYEDELRLFENNLPYDPSTIQRSYSDYIREIILGALHDGRDVFVGPEIENKYLYGFNKVPYGLLFELKTDTSYVPFSPSHDLNGFRAAQKVDNPYSHQILNFYETMFLARAAYEYSHKHLALTLGWLYKALEVNPNSQQAQAARLQILQELRSIK